MMKFVMLILLTALGTVTCARMDAADPDDSHVFCEDTDPVDAVSGADPAFQFISYHQPGNDGLMNPFEETAPEPTAAPTELPDGYAGQVFDAVKAGRWLVVIGLLLAGLVYLLRKGLGEVWPWFKTDRGGVVLVLSTTFLATIAHGMASGAPPSLGAFAGALAAAWSASGALSHIKRTINPPDKAPPPARSKPVAVR